MDKASFGFWNWVVVALYLVGMLLIGFYFSKKSSKDTDAYFKAGGQVPGWAVGLSIVGTTLSSITFMSIPEKSYLTDWGYAFGNLTVFLIIPIMMRYFVPFYRKLNVTTAYEYVEKRFNPLLRAISSALFILYHIGRIAVVIYLPVLGIASVTDINPVLISVIIGVLCVVYTLMGGLEGVIWSDVIQTIVLMGGALLICVVGALQVKGGFSTVVNVAAADNKILSAANFSVSDIANWVPLIIAGQFFNSLYQYAASQDVVQRYQATNSIEETRKSMNTVGYMSLLVVLLFFGMGTVLYAFYQTTGALPEGFNTGAIVPFFAITQLPVGVAGLVIAAIFAAAQSTIASSLNALSSCFVTDFKQRFFDDAFHGMSDVTLAKWVVGIAGFVSTAVTIYFAMGNSSETWDLFLTVSGLFGVPIAGIFCLGVFTEKANSTGVLLGFLASIILAFYANSMEISSLLVAVIAFIAAVGFGYIFSLIFPNGKKQVKGLTVHSMEELEGE